MYKWMETEAEHRRGTNGRHARGRAGTVNYGRLMAVVVLSALTALVAPECTSNLTGGTSIPNQITGVVYSPQGQPIPNAWVVLIRDSGTGNMWLAAVDSTNTNSGGTYIFEDIGAGRYAIEATARDSSFITVHSGIAVNAGGPKVTLSDTMRSGGSIRGTAALPSGPMVDMRIYGTHYRAPLSNGGVFSFGLLLPGKHVVLTVVSPLSSNIRVAAHIDTVEVHESKTAVPDTIRVLPLYGGPGDHVLDDFEDGDVVNNLGSWWWSFNNSLDGGNSTVTPGPGDSAQKMSVSPGAAGTQRCAHIAYRMGTHGIHYAGMGCNLVGHYNGILQSRDLSGARRLCFWLRGSGGSIYVALVSHAVEKGSNEVLNLKATPLAWSFYSLDLDSVFTTAGGAALAVWKETRPFVDQLIFVCNSDTTDARGELWIDEVRFEF